MHLLYVKLARALVRADLRQRARLEMVMLARGLLLRDGDHVLARALHQHEHTLGPLALLGPRHRCLLARVVRLKKAIVTVTLLLGLVVSIELIILIGAAVRATVQVG